MLRRQGVLWVDFNDWGSKANEIIFMAEMKTTHYFSQATVIIVKDHHEALIAIKCSGKQLRNTVMEFV